MGSSRDFAFPSSYLGREREREAGDLQISSGVGGNKGRGIAPGGPLEISGTRTQNKGLLRSMGRATKGERERGLLKWGSGMQSLSNLKLL